MLNLSCRRVGELMITLSSWLLYVSFAPPNLPHNRLILIYLDVLHNILCLLSNRNSLWNRSAPRRYPPRASPKSSLLLVAMRALLRYNNGLHPPLHRCLPASNMCQASSQLDYLRNNDNGYSFLNLLLLPRPLPM